MVDELTQESFQTGKAIVTVSVDLITAIADACKRSEQQNPGMSEEQKETLLGKVVDKVMSNYKETHGSLKGFNREGKDVTHIDVNDERTAELLEKACKKSHIPVDMKKVTRADGSITHTAFCEVKSIDQMAALLKMASEQVLEEQKEMTKTLVLYDDKGKEVMSADFVNNGEINMDDVEHCQDSLRDLRSRITRMKFWNPEVSHQMQRRKSRKRRENIIRRRISRLRRESRTRRSSHRRNRKTRTGSVKKRRKRAGIQVCRWCLWERRILAVPYSMT